MENFSRSTIETLTHISTKYGSGVLVNDILVFLLILGLVTLLLALSAYRKALSLKTPPGLERVTSIAGRVEKLEMTLNEFRIETMRSLELFRGDMGFLKQELSEIRKAVSKGQSEGGDGGGNSGGQGGYEQESGSGYKVPESDLSAPTKSERDEDAFPPPPESHNSMAYTESVGSDSSVASAIAANANVLKTKLSKSRFGFFERIKNIFTGGAALNPALLDELEVNLITSDLGVKMTSSLMANLRNDLKLGKQVDEGQFVDLLKKKILEILSRDADPKTSIDPFRLVNSGKAGPLVIMVVGVNGVGKTTTVAKLANQFRLDGAKIMLAAADTFRAAAVEQLKAWGERVQVPVISGAPECKPATVVYDAMLAAKQQEVDVLIIDTAGRLHTKSNLMQELEGVKNAISRHLPDAPHETILVVDGSTGQNAISQAREFNAATPLSGLVVTKLDGTSKGGIVVAIKDELGIPIRYIGVGEAAEDLKAFSANDFVEALLDRNTSASVSAEVKATSAHGEVRRRRREEGSLNLH